MGNELSKLVLICETFVRLTTLNIAFMKRLEFISVSSTSTVYKQFAHSRSSIAEEHRDFGPIESYSKLVPYWLLSK